jgi:hypothetical protein
MKTLKFLSMIFTIMLIAGFSQLNAQATQIHESQFISVEVECANDGLGEWVSGTIEIHGVIDKNGGYIYHPQGQYLTGEDTGIKYRAVGATIERLDNETENGAITYSFINRFHFVGKGTQYYLKGNFHYVENSSGVVVDHGTSVVTCK